MFLLRKFLYFHNVCCDNPNVSKFSLQMESWSEEIPLFYWLSSVIISSTCLLCTIPIFLRERRKREKQKVLFPSKYLSLFSWICILFGPINILLQSCAFIPGFCLVYRYPRPLVTVQFAAMECYQLSRVYYCFSQKKVHSDKGYPKWVFYVAFTGTAIWFLASLFFNYSWITTNCYIQVDGSSRESFQNEGIHFFP